MTAPVYATDLTDILVEMSATTGWTALGGGAGGLVAPETDFFIQGTNDISKAGWSTATKGMIYNNGSGITVPSGKAVYSWIYYWAPNSLAAEASGGLQALIGSGTAAFKQWYIRGSDTLVYGGWVCAVVDPTVSADATTGSPTTTLQYFGAQANVPAGGPSKGQPLGIDAMRYGRDFTCTGGDGTSGYATFAGAATFNDYNDATNGYHRYGQFQTIDGGYLMQCRFLMGSSGTAVDFRDSNRNILIARTTKVTSSFNRFEVVNASSNVSWTSVSISALGTTSRGDFVTTDNATVAFTGCTFTDMGTFGFLSNATLTTTVFRRCNLVTQSGATFNGCTFDSTNDSVKAITSDNPGLISNSTFKSSGTKHGLEIRPTGAGPFSYNLSNCTFTGYASSDGTTGNEAIYINPVTASANITLNITNGGSTPSIRLASGYTGTFTLVLNPVTLTITAKDIVTLAAISSARVLVLADAGGSLPSQVTVTITSSGTTATVAHTSHGLVTGNVVQIKGANQQPYNGIYTITFINANSYSYTMGSSTTSPATGTIKSTAVLINGTTDGSGQITDTRSYSGNQPITGRVRHATSGTLYKTAPIAGTVSSTAGLSLTIQMIPDQ